MGVDGSATALFLQPWTLTETANGEQTITITYAVKVTSNLDGPVVAATAAGLPARHSTYAVGNDTLTTVYCTERRWRKETMEGNVWLCDCTFSTITGNRDENGTPTDNPEDWRTQYEILSSQRQRDVTRAAYQQFENGDTFFPIRPGVGQNDPALGAIVNTAGDPIDPVPQMDDSRQHYRATFYEKTPDVERYGDYYNAVNSDAFSISQVDIAGNNDVLWSRQFQPGDCKIMNITLSDQIVNNAAYSKVAIEFAYDPNGWWMVIPDRGMSLRGCDGDPDGRGGTVEAGDRVDGMSDQQIAFDLLGNPKNHPFLLDGAGQPLLCGADPVNMLWKVYTELPFAILGI